MVHHVHGQSHLVRRQRNRDPDDDNNVETVVSVRVITAQNTFTGNVIWVTQTQQQPAQQTDAPKTMIAPAVRSTNTQTGGDTKQTSKPATSQKQSAAVSQNVANSSPTEKAKDDSTLMVATRVPTPTAAAGIASVTASITAAAAPASDGGMSGGAKAGLALGILVIIGALLVGILLVYRRKKKQMAPKDDNEKIDLHNAPPPPPPQVQTAPAFTPAPAAAPSIRTERTMSTAPRLSLRPVTQFDPAFENKQQNNSTGGASLLVPGAVAAGAHSQEKDLPHRPTSSWERPGASNVPAENPFSDPQQPSGPPSANPFGNNAALDAAQARIPDSPPNASPLQASNEFPAPAKKSVDIDPVAAATAMATVPSPSSEFPAPPSIKAPSEGIPPSPAWTEDLPASPGPAPTGPPPVAGAIVGPRSNSPAPAPNNVHRVQLDFKPSMQDELDLQAGQLVRMLHEYDDGWALCIRMDRSQQGVVPRTCLSKHPVKPRTGPPRQGPPPPGMRGPPIRSPMGPGGVPQPRPLSPASGRNSPHPPAFANNGRMSPGPRAMSPGPRQMSPPMQGGPRARSNSNAPQYGPPRGRSNSNAPYAGPPRSMSPGPYGGGPQMAPPPQMEGRPRSNSASQAGQPRRGPAPGPSPMNPNGAPSPAPAQMPARKPVPGMAM